MVQITGQNETHRDNEGNIRVTCKKTKSSSKYEEWGAFTLMYRDGEVHVPFGIGTYVSAIRGQYGGSNSESSTVIEGFRRYSKMIWADVSKRSLYIHNILLEPGGFIQKVVLKRARNVQDMRLEFLEMDQTSRMVEKIDSLQVFRGNGEAYKPERLLLPDHFANTPADWM